MRKPGFYKVTIIKTNQTKMAEWTNKIHEQWEIEGMLFMDRELIIHEFVCNSF